MTRTSDTTIVVMCLLFFIICSLVLTTLNNEINADLETENVENKLSDLQKEAYKTTKLSLTTFALFLFNMFKMMTFTFGSIPFLVDIIVIMPIRIVFWFTIGKQLIGSGA